MSTYLIIYLVGCLAVILISFFENRYCDTAISFRLALLMSIFSWVLLVLYLFDKLGGASIYTRFDSWFKSYK